MLGMSCKLDDSPALGLEVSLCLERLLDALDVLVGLPIGESADPTDPTLSVDGCLLDAFGKLGKSRPGESFIPFLADESVPKTYK